MTERKITLVHRIEDDGETEHVGYESADDFLKIELLGILDLLKHAILTNDLQEEPEDDEDEEPSDFICRHPKLDEEGRCLVCQDLTILIPETKPGRVCELHCVERDDSCYTDYARQNHEKICCDCGRALK